MTSLLVVGRPTLRLRRGVTSIALVVGASVVAIMAAVVLPWVENMQRKGHRAVVRADLRNLAIAQELSMVSRGIYQDDVTLLRFSFSPEVQLVGPIVVTPGGWSARVRHAQLSPETCAVFHGSADPVGPAATEGVVTCGP